MNRRSAGKIWRLPVAWLACDDAQEAIEPPASQVIVVYVQVPYGTPLPAGVRQAVTPARTPPAITAGANGRNER